MPRPVGICLCSILMVALSGCARQAIVGDREVALSSKEEMQLLVNRVKEINAGSVDSYTAGFIGEGLMKKKRLSFTGEALFNKNPRLVKFTFLDTVFKSPMTVIVQDGDSLKFYFPVDKSLLLDNVRTIRLKNYMDIDADFNSLYPLAAGQIPLIQNFAIKSGLISKADDPSNAGQRYLILENDDYFQTISFREGTPDKILLVHKPSTRKLEIYLEKPAAQGKSVFYRSVRFVLLPSGDKLAINFRDVRFNAPMDSNTILKLNLDKGTKYINMEK